MSYLSRTKVGVLRGGPSGEYDVSLKTGATVLRSLPLEKYAPIDIVIDKGGVWHMRGKPVYADQVLPQLDVVFIAVHGADGADGKLQRLVDRFGVPYAGSAPLATATASHKHRAKLALRGIGVKLPRHIVLSIDEITDPQAFVEELHAEFQLPFVVKPVMSGSSRGVSLVHSYEEIGPALARAFDEGDQIVVEEYIAGREATCGIIENFRGARHYPLLPLEVVPPASASFFDYDTKVGGTAAMHGSNHFSPAEKAELQRLTQLVHETLGLRHYSRSDFIIARDGTYFLETNALPALGEGTAMSHALNEIGSTDAAFVAHLLDLALAR